MGFKHFSMDLEGDFLGIRAKNKQETIFFVLPKINVDVEDDSLGLWPTTSLYILWPKMYNEIYGGHMNQQSNSICGSYYDFHKSYRVSTTSIFANDFYHVKTDGMKNQF